MRLQHDMNARRRTTVTEKDSSPIRLAIGLFLSTPSPKVQLRSNLLESHYNGVGGVLGRNINKAKQIFRIRYSVIIVVRIKFPTPSPSLSISSLASSGKASYSSCVPSLSSSVSALLPRPSRSVSNCSSGSMGSASSTKLLDSIISAEAPAFHPSGAPSHRYQAMLPDHSGMRLRNLLRRHHRGLHLDLYCPRCHPRLSNHSVSS